jgi:hypothetical protein
MASPDGSRGGFAAWQVPTGRGSVRESVSEVPAGRAGDLQRGKSRRVECGGEDENNRIKEYMNN